MAVRDDRAEAVNGDPCSGCGAATDIGKVCWRCGRGLDGHAPHTCWIDPTKDTSAVAGPVATALGVSFEEWIRDFKATLYSRIGRLADYDEVDRMFECKATKRTPRPSMRAAINRMCKECIYDPKAGGGNWRQQVGACAMTACPLHVLRPVSRPKKAARDGAGG